jgi:hypothetical protein
MVTQNNKSCVRVGHRESGGSKEKLTIVKGFLGVKFFKILGKHAANSTDHTKKMMMLVAQAPDGVLDTTTVFV